MFTGTPYRQQNENPFFLLGSMVMQQSYVCALIAMMVNTITIISYNPPYIFNFLYCGMNKGNIESHFIYQELWASAGIVISLEAHTVFEQNKKVQTFRNFFSLNFRYCIITQNCKQSADLSSYFLTVQMFFILISLIPLGSIRLVKVFLIFIVIEKLNLNIKT